MSSSSRFFFIDILSHTHFCTFPPPYERNRFSTWTTSSHIRRSTLLWHAEIVSLSLHLSRLFSDPHTNLSPWCYNIYLYVNVRANVFPSFLFFLFVSISLPLNYICVLILPYYKPPPGRVTSSKKKLKKKNGKNATKNSKKRKEPTTTINKNVALSLSLLLFRSSVPDLLSLLFELLFTFVHYFIVMFFFFTIPVLCPLLCRKQLRNVVCTALPLTSPTPIIILFYFFHHE